MVIVYKRLFHPSIPKGGEITPNHSSLPFRNHLELVDAHWRLFLNMNWVQDGAFRRYLAPTRNPIWQPEIKYYEISLLQDISAGVATTNEISTATITFATFPDRCMALLTGPYIGPTSGTPQVGHEIGSGNNF